MLDNEAGAFMAAYAVQLGDSWEAKSILELISSLDQRPALAEARPALFWARDERVHPGRDDVQLALTRQLPGNAADGDGSIAKVLTSWNGPMLATFAQATRALDRDDYGQVAERDATFLPRELRRISDDCVTPGRSEMPGSTSTWRAMPI